MNPRHDSIPRLSIPFTSISPMALNALDAGDGDVMELLWRHGCGDWGEVESERRDLNEVGLREGSELVGVYPLKTGERIVLLTEPLHHLTHLVTAAENAACHGNVTKAERQSALLAQRGDGPRPQFPLGTVTLTRDAIHALVLSGGTPLPFLRRHACGDWGMLSIQEKRLNRRWLIDNGKLFSRYETMLGEVLLVETDADRQATTMLLEEEK